MNSLKRYRSSAIRPTILNSISRRSSGIARTGLLMLIKDGVDSIGLSVEALLAALPDEHKSIYFADVNDAGTKYDDATIITNIEASEYLNDGGELVGDATRKAQYADGTDMDKAYRYFRIEIPGGDELIIDGSFLTIGGSPLTIGV